MQRLLGAGKIEEQIKAAVRLSEGGLPRSRRYLSVPFVGKDAPSHAAEFAHPDVAIGLTILAYRYASRSRSTYDLGEVYRWRRALPDQ